MRKKILPFITVLMLALFVGSCSNEDVMPEIDKGATSRTITFTASMPGEDDPATRVSVAEEADRTIALTWDANDKLDLLFVQGETKIQRSTTVESITDDGKKASFTIVIPEGIIEGESFSLYGVYGGGEVDATNPQLIKLPAIEGTTLNEENVGKKVMLRFAKTVDATGAVGTVNFKHVGFLFTTKIKVTTGSVNDITSVQLVGADAGNETWAYNASANHFNMESGTFTTEVTGSNAVSLINAEKDATNNILTVRNWLPATETAWPAIKLSINGTTETATTKPGRTPVASKAYYLYATWDGADLVFDDKGTKENPFTVAEAFGAQGRSDVWVKGYIVGYKIGSPYNVGFKIEDASGTNIVIADNVDEADGTKALGIQLVPGAARNDLNLADNPHMYKAEVLLKGNLGGYFSGDEGLLNVKDYVLISANPFFITDVTEVELAASGDAITGKVTINTNEDQAWTVASSASWLTPAPASGSGNADIVLTATENTAEAVRTATVTITPTANADLTPIVVNVTQLGTVAPPAELLFPGADFNNWTTFLSSLSTDGLTFGKESATGGRGGSGALHLEGKSGGDDYVFTALVPEGFSATGKTMIHFWIKGTAAKSLSLNVYVGGYWPYNLGSATDDVVLKRAGYNQYDGTIDTGGKWIKVSLDISKIAINTTPGQNLFALKVGKDATYNLYIDDITIE